MPKARTTIAGGDGPVAVSHVDAAGEEEADGHDGHAGPDHERGAEALHELGAGGGDDEHGGGHGQHADAGLERRVAEGELQQLGQDEQRAEHGEHHQGDGAGRHAEAAVGEEPEVEHRVVAPSLPGHEGGADGEGQRQAPHGHDVAPAVVRRLDQRPHERREADDRQGGAPDVEAGLRRVPGLRQQHPPGDECEDDERDVDEQHRAPPEVLEQPAAGDRPDGDAEPATPAQAAMAWARSLGSVNRFVMIDRVAGMTKAAPTPMRARAAISSPTLPDRAPATEAMPNRAIPAVSDRRRP
jgi:hypothetical protein